MIGKPLDSDVPAYFHSYFKLIDGTDLIEELHTSRTSSLKLFSSLSTEMENYAYAEGKWTIKEVFRHIIDCERIYAYRALRFSRFDAVNLPGFNENKYISKVTPHQFHMDKMLIEYESIRESNIQLFGNMNEEMLDFKGTANNLEMSARVIGFMVVAHNLHHCKIIRERYLDPNP